VRDWLVEARPGAQMPGFAERARAIVARDAELVKEL
jgi:hypothetical protein